MRRAFRVIAAVVCAVGFILVILVSPTVGLFAVGGLIAGLLVRWFLARLRRSVEARRQSPSPVRVPQRGRRAKLRVIVAVTLGVVGLVLLVIIVPNFVLYQMCGRRGFGVHYQARVVLDQAREAWEVSEQILLDPSRFEDPDVRDALDSAGWGLEATEDDRPLLVRHRTFNVPSGWFPIPKVTTITTSLFSSSRTYGVIDGSSFASVVASDGAILETYPKATSRSNCLAGDSEKLIVPLGGGADDDGVLRIKLASRPFRNRVFRWIVLMVVAPAFKWLLLAVALIFSGQIRNGLFVPLVKRIFRLLGLKYSEEKQGSS